MERQSADISQKTAKHNDHVRRPSAAPSLPAPALVQLQRSIGNHAVQRLIHSPYIQLKLQISKPGDPFEQEADQVADTVMRMAEPATSREASAHITPLVQRESDKPEDEDETMVSPKSHGVPVAVREDDDDEEKVQRLCNGCEEETVNRKETDDEEEVISRAAVPHVSAPASANIHAMQGGGSPLSPATRAFFEPRFGADFSRVRVHTDSRAVSTANSIQAKAFTVGPNIAFGAGQYEPESRQGRHLLAHELTHVVQQNGSQVQHAQPRAADQAPPAHEFAHDIPQRQAGVAKVMRQPAEEEKRKLVAPPCPGSCHVHVEHYERAFGGGGAEPLSGSLLERKPVPLSQQELQTLYDWIERSKSGTVTPVAPSVTASNELTGGPLKSDVATEYEKHKAEFQAKPNNRVKIIRFAVPAESDPDWPKYRASEISADQKKKTFVSLGLMPEEKVFPRNVTSKDFSEYIKEQNADTKVFGIIVQLPTPPQLRSDVSKIAAAKDIDSLSAKPDRSFKAPATADAVVRVVLAMLKPGQTVAVIGGGPADAGALGFVGGAVVELLREHRITVKVFEKGDDLKEVKKYDLVVSAVGTPRVVQKEHLKPQHELVVDTGFIPEKGGKVVGDVEESARGIPRYITPVPGGTGPIEMAVLMERAAKLLGIKARSWQVELRGGKLRAVFIP